MPLQIRQMVASACCLLAMTGYGLAKSAGWSTSYNMGTLAAGVANATNGRITFYCGDGAAARANPVIQGGPYLEVALPKAPGLERAASLDLVVDGKATAIPVAAQAEGETVSLSWRPGGRFGTSQMKIVVASLRKAKSIEVKAAGQSARFPVQGAAKALADDPLGCK